jgi:hypothetical protein
MADAAIDADTAFAAMTQQVLKSDRVRQRVEGDLAGPGRSV